MAVQNVRVKGLSIGLDDETLELLGLELVDRDAGVAAVLDAGDAISVGGKEYEITDADFADTESLAAKLAAVSGAKVRVVPRNESGRFYLLFSDPKSVSRKLSHVVAVEEELRDDAVLIRDHKALIGADVMTLRAPLDPAASLCSAQAGQVLEECYQAHVDYLSGVFVFHDFAQECARWGLAISLNFDAGEAIASAWLDTYFDKRNLAETTYAAAVLAGARRIEALAAAE